MSSSSRVQGLLACRIACKGVAKPWGPFKVETGLSDLHSSTFLCCVMYSFH